MEALFKLKRKNKTQHNKKQKSTQKSKVKVFQKASIN